MKKLRQTKTVYNEMFNGFLIVLFLGTFFILKAMPAKAEPASVLYFNPASVAVKNGQAFKLTAMIDPGTNSVVAAELHVKFDSTKFNLLSVTPEETSDCVTNPQMTQTLSQAKIDNAAGTASIILGVCLSNPVTYIKKPTTVATFVFRALAEANSSSIEITDSTKVSAMEEKDDVLIARNPATVSVASSSAFRWWNPLTWFGAFINWLNSR